MNIAPISAPKTMMPPTAATQKVGRTATLRSYRGFLARRCRKTKSTVAIAAMTNRLTAIVRALATGRKLSARTKVPMSTTERMPPMLSTDSFPSLMCAGMNFSAMRIAATATGMTTRKTQGQSATSRIRPDSSGPDTEIAPPMAAHNAIERVRAGPGPHSAAIKERVVGYAMPAAKPPKRRPKIKTLIVGANPLMSAAGIASATPRTAISLRP